MDEEQHECGNRKEQKFHNCFGRTHWSQFNRCLVLLASAPLHVMIFFEHPRIATVMGFFDGPMKGLRPDFTERPAYRKPIGIRAAQDDAITFATPLRADHIVVLWVDEDDAPLF